MQKHSLSLSLSLSHRLKTQAHPSTLFRARLDRFINIRIIKFSIIDISATVGPSSILSLICDHDIFRVQTGQIDDFLRPQLD